MTPVTPAVTPAVRDLRDELKTRGYHNQAEIARRMGISGAQLSRLLSGQRKWSLLTARAFSMATGIPLAVIQGRDGEREA